MRMVLAVTVSILFILACGDGGEDAPVASDPAPTPFPVAQAIATAARTASPVQEVSMEAALRERAESHAKAYTDANWPDAYDHMSPRFRQICDSVQFGIQRATGMFMFASLYGLDERNLGFSVERVSVDDEVGLVYGGFLYEGQPALLAEQGDVGQRWVFVDGNWWQESEGWASGC